MWRFCFHFHLRNLMILVVFLGLGFAALRAATDLWDSVVFSATIGVLMVSTLLAIHRRDEERAFWAGHALLGWAYVILTLIPSVESRLLTTRALGYLDSMAPGLTTSVSGGTNSRFTYPQVLISDGVSTISLVRAWGGTSENFVRIGHSLFALILAFLGGSLSRRLYLANRGRHPEPDDP